MTLDDHLRRASEALSERVRAETERQLATLGAELKGEADAAVAAAEARGREALDRAVEAARAEGRQLGKEEGLEIGRAEGLKEGREQGRAAGLEEGKRTGRAEGLDYGKAEGKKEGFAEGLAELQTLALAATERLVDAIRAIDAARSLTEVLDALASAAGREASRVAVLLVGNGGFRGWRFIGFGVALDERKDVELKADEAGIIAEAARTGAIVSADSEVTASAPSFAELPPGRERLAVPVQMSGQVVAVLYADQGLPSDQPHGTARPSRSTSTVSWPMTLEALARHGARCLEAITAVRAAQVLTERPEIPSKTAEEDAGSEPSARDADREQAARRYARLLVSEIKMYHESAVIAGRRERDLATRLGGEIALARVLYEQRVPADERAGTDFFHEELVRTLADGDRGLLARDSKLETRNSKLET